MSNLTRRGPNANAPARLPGIQTTRVSDPNTRQALEALREWVEVRLGARGDFYERAVTQRDLETQITTLRGLIDRLSLSSGSDRATPAVSPTDFDAFRAALASLESALRQELILLQSRMRNVEQTTLGITDHGTLTGLGDNDHPQYALLDAANEFTKGQAVTFVTLTDGATISTDAALGNHFVVTLGGNRTVANPTNLHDGQILNYWVKQDGTGGRTLTWGSKFKWPAGTAPTLTTGADALDVVAVQYNLALDILVGSAIRDVR